MKTTNSSMQEAQQQIPIMELLAAAIRKRNRKHLDCKRRCKNVFSWGLRDCRKCDIIFKKLLKFMCLAVSQDTRWAYKNLFYLCILGKSNLQLIKFISFIKIYILKISSKILEIKLTWNLQHFYTKNYKALPKEIKEDLNKWTDIPCSCVWKFSITAMSDFPRMIPWPYPLGLRPCDRTSSLSHELDSYTCFFILFCFESAESPTHQERSV